MSQAYLPRIADRVLASSLASSGAVLIEGPKACGKTATAIRVANSVVRLDTDSNARATAGVAPEVLFELEPPILFDEWQLEPALWNHVRRAVDDRSPARGQFILTGSATPNDGVTRHSGAGRFATLAMRPMSLFESGHATGDVSISRLFDGESPRALEPGLTVPDLIDRIVVGGWPTLLEASPVEASRWVRNYITQIVEVDIPGLGLRRNPRVLRRLLASLGRNVGTPVTVVELAKDVGADSGTTPARETIHDYLAVLDRLRLTDDVPAWAPHMRSKTPLRTSAVRYLTDPSLGTGALGANPQALLSDLNATGFHFEAMVIRDLRAYVQPLDGALHHWRDNNAHEVDVVVTLPDGRWGAFEVKMNRDDADLAARSLLKFRNKVDTSRVGAPSFLGVITTTGFSFRRGDGVCVMAVGALGP